MGPKSNAKRLYQRHRGQTHSREGVGRQRLRLEGCCHGPGGAWSPPRLEDAGTQTALVFLEGVWPCWHLDSGFLMRAYISIVLSH